jgi:hypothetical protein
MSTIKQKAQMLDHLMTRALGDSTSNLERLPIWKKDILLGGLGDLTKMWITLSRLSDEVQRILSKCNVTDATRNCPENSLDERV